MDRRLSGWQLLLDASQFDGQDLVPWSVDPKSPYRRLYPSEMVQIGLVDEVYVVGWDYSADFRDSVNRVKVWVDREQNYSYISKEAVALGLLDYYFAEDGGTRESLRVDIKPGDGKYGIIDISAQVQCRLCSKVIRRSLADTFLCGGCAPGHPNPSQGTDHLFAYLLIEPVLL